MADLVSTRVFGTLTISDKLHVKRDSSIQGGLSVTGSIGNNPGTYGVNMGLSGGGDPQLQLQGDGDTNTSPHIDFSTGLSSDYDVRLLLNGTDRLSLLGVDDTNGFLVNGYKVFHAGNGGAGSGLDADKLDGVQGSQFLRSDTTDAFTGEITGNILILGGGQIQNSGAALQVNGFSRMGSIWLHEGDTPEATPGKKLTNTDGDLIWSGSQVWTDANATAKALTQMQKYGLGGSGISTSDVNLDGLVASGFYGMYQSTQNAWAGQASGDTMIHARWGSNHASQIGMGQTGELHFRTQNDGTWTAWHEVWHTGNDGAGSGLDADKLDGQHASHFAPVTNANLITPDINDSQVRTLVFDNLEATNVAAKGDGGLGFDSSQGLLIHRTQSIGTAVGAGVYKVLDASNVAAGDNIEFGNIGPDLLGTEPFIISVKQGAGSGLDADKLDGLQATDFTRSVYDGSYYGLAAPGANASNWIRTTVNGFIPATSGGASKLGTSSWPFLEAHVNTVYEGGATLASRYLGKTAKAADADKLDGVQGSNYARLDGSGSQTSTKALNLDLQGHVGDGGNDYGLIVQAFEPAVSLIDKSTNAHSGQLLFSGSAFFLRHQSANDGTIGHSDATVAHQTLMKVSTTQLLWMGNDVWHAGNAPIASSNVSNAVVKRDSSGDINARLFRSEFNNSNSSIGYIMTQVDTAGNNYIRPSTPAHFRAAVTDGQYIDKANGTATGQLSFSGEGDSTGIRFHSGNDSCGVRLRNPGGNSGEMEFWTADDDLEPFVFRSYASGHTGTGAYTEWAKISAAGLEIKSGDIHSNNGAFVAHGNVSSNANIDHMWHSDGENAWHFVSDGTYGARGNSTLIAKTLVADSASGITAEGMVSRSNANTVLDLSYDAIASNAIGMHTNNSIAIMFDTNNNSTDGNLNFTVGHNGGFGGTNYEELMKIDGIGSYFSKPIYEQGRRVLSEGGIGQFEFSNQDFKGRGKRIAVATTGDLILNYANDFTQVKVQSDMTLDAGTNTSLTILSDDGGISTLNLYGADQGSGMVYVGQSATHGGGIEYNGDNTPTTTGAGSDYISLFRRNASTDSWTARNKYNSNDWQFRGNVTAYASDARLKENVEVIPDALSKLHEVRGVTYDWREECESLGFMPTQRHEHGVIAQEVQKVVPDAVVPAPFDNDYLTVQHERLIPLLIEAVKELSNKFDQLEARI
ncbi:tail fiber domain-containing protein [Cobetia sp. SIMBA_158]|uniref:tail fiber domain-containing protein n=1 Tax=Cobetia sp. SIMBA_158 TaxID=3081617 RepID=UPI00398186DE